ncbi:MAG: GPW/gp25 family protein [Pseudomonadota bacterium]
MPGIDRNTGKPIDGWPHVVQSIEDIFTTEIGTRLMRRDYGSAVPRLIDANMTESALLHLRVAIADALAKWEPRFRITHAHFSEVSPEGRSTIDVRGHYLPRGHLGDTSIQIERGVIFDI